VTQEVEKLNASRKEQDRRLIHNRREYLPGEPWND
jgi:hypothetical protein